MRLSAIEKSWFESSKVGSVNVVSVLNVHGIVTRRFLEKALEEFFLRHPRWAMTVQDGDKKWTRVTSEELPISCAQPNVPVLQLAEQAGNDAMVNGGYFVRILWQPVGNDYHNLIVSYHHMFMDAFCCKVFNQEILSSLEAFQTDNLRQVPRASVPVKRVLKKGPLPNFLWRSIINQVRPFSTWKKNERKATTGVTPFEVPKEAVRQLENHGCGAQELLVASTILAAHKIGMDDAKPQFKISFLVDMRPFINDPTEMTCHVSLVDTCHKLAECGDIISLAKEVRSKLLKGLKRGDHHNVIPIAKRSLPWARRLGVDTLSSLGVSFVDDRARPASTSSYQVLDFWSYSALNGIASPLGLVIYSTESRYHGTLSYRQDRFSRDQAEEIVKHVEDFFRATGQTIADV